MQLNLRWFSALYPRQLLFLAFIIGAGLSQITWATLPAFMQPYADWLTLENPRFKCTPVIVAGDVQRQCNWNSVLDVELTEKGAHFRAQGELEIPSLVVLPGARDYWPKSVFVTLDGKSRNLPVIEYNNSAPAVSLPAGRFALEGQYDWAEIPKTLQVPEHWAVVKLQTPANVSWKRLKGVVEIRKTQKIEQNNTQSLQVYRHLLEAKPQILTTRLVLSITGAPRFLVIPRLQKSASRQIALNSNLPFTLLANGSIQLQVRPGRYWIEQQVRLSPQMQFAYESPPNDELEVNDMHWPSAEYWSFEAKNQSSLKVIDGELVDAVQVNVPDSWRHLPTYKVSNTTNLTLATQPYQKPLNKTSLQLLKSIWLSFDGSEYTTVDTITGQLGNHWRLDLQPPAQLERATLNNEPLLITQNLGDDDVLRDGIELRSPHLALDAITRQPRMSTLNVSGWNYQFDTVTSRLHLPPGWSLFAVLGDRGTSDDWLNQWTLWSIFVVMIFISTAFKSLGLSGVFLSVGVALLSYQIRPTFVIFLFAACACVFALNKVRGDAVVFKKSLLGLLLVIGSLFLISATPYTIEMVRLVVYPQLEQKQISPPVTPQVAPEQLSYSQIQPKARMSVMADTAEKFQQKPSKIPVGEHDFIQTGQAAPQWHWNEFNLGTRGITDSEEQQQVVLMEPWQTRLWRLGSVFFIWCMFLRLSLSSSRHLCLFKATNRQGAKVVCIALLLSLGFMPDVSVARESPLQLPLKAPSASETENTLQNTISQNMLDDLRDYLHRAPVCMPHCIGVSQGHLNIAEQILTWTLYLNAATETALPLPSSDQWNPTELRIDGIHAPVALMRQAGQVYVKVPEGRTRLDIAGTITGAEVTFLLPTTLHNMTYELPGWSVSQSKLPVSLAQQLRLEKRPMAIQKKQSQVKTQDLVKIQDSFTANYLEIERYLVLGTRWTLNTRVTRKAPSQGLIEVKYPLWPGEKPNQNLDIDQGYVTIRMIKNTVQWTSELEPTDRLLLTSQAGADYYETWQVEASARWRFHYEGLQEEPLEYPIGLISKWRPVAGDQVVLYAAKPSAKKAPSQSVDQASLSYELGARTNQASLDLQLLAASPGEYRLELSEDAVIDSIRLNGRSIWSEGHNITVPLVAGRHQLLVEWSLPATDGFVQGSPELQSSLPLANLNLTMIPLPRTWIIGVFGPKLGPAVLFWGVLAVIIMGAFGLSRLQRVYEARLSVAMPLKNLDWLLLGLGLSSVWYYGLLPIALWLFILGWRLQIEPVKLFRPLTFKLIQLLIISLGIFVALLVMFLIPKGLLVTPEMLIQGNGSNASALRWFQDTTSGQVPEFGFWSLPTWTFHGLMLIWSLWLAQKVLIWFQYAFKALQQGGCWKLTKPADQTLKKSD